LHRRPNAITLRPTCEVSAQPVPLRLKSRTIRRPALRFPTAAMTGDGRRSPRS
jgi:hypothetical protein